MRLILIMASLVTIYSFLNRPKELVGGATYYISTSGSDANDGLSPANAWQHLSKINSGIFIPGDSILLKRGDVFNDSIRISNSGTSLFPIVIGAYGTGVKPEITGFQTLSMSNAGGNIWTGTASNSIKNQNTILINDTIRIKARFPNSGYKIFVPFNLTTTYLAIPHTDTNYVGSEVVVQGTAWDLAVAEISLQKTGVTYDTLVFGKANYYGGQHGSQGYFFQNMPAYLDSANEWSFDSTTKLISVYSVSTPTVKYSSIDTVIKIHKQSYITFDNITISGANIDGFETDSSTGVIVKNCSIKNCGVNAFYSISTNGFSIHNDSVTNILNNVLSSKPDTGLVFEDNYVNNIGIYAGMGKAIDYQIGTGYTGIYNFGNNFSFQRNKLLNIGYIPIYFTGSMGVIQNNYIDSFVFIKTDGGGIDAFENLTTSHLDSGTIIKKNIITSSGGFISAVMDVQPLAVGIYLDHATFNVIVDSNTITKTVLGILINGPYNNVTNNIINSSRQTLNPQNGLVYSFSNGINTGATNTNGNVKRNIIYNQYSSGYSLSLSSILDTTQAIDSNYYLKPVDTTKTINVISTLYSLSGSQAAYPRYNAHSIASLPYGYSSTLPTIFYNKKTSGDSTIALIGNWSDVYNNFYYGSVNLKAGTSKLLFPSSLTPRFSFRIGGFKFR